MQSPPLVFRPSTNDSTKLTETTRKKDWFFLSYPLSPLNIACVILEEVTNFCVLRPTQNVELFIRRTKLSELSLWEVRRLAWALINQLLKKAKGTVENGCYWVSELLSAITYLQIPHLSEWNGFFSTPVKCLHMKQKYAAICSPQPLQYWFPSLI